MQEHENYCNDCQGCLTPGCYGACDCKVEVDGISAETCQVLIEESLVEEFGEPPPHPGLVQAFKDLAEGNSTYYDNDEDFMASLGDGMAYTDLGDEGCYCGDDCPCHQIEVPTHEDVKAKAVPMMLDAKLASLVRDRNRLLVAGNVIESRDPNSYQEELNDHINEIDAEILDLALERYGE